MNDQKVKFEDKIQRLEQIVRAMERGDIPLDESLQLFQEGTKLVQECGTMLDQAELQVKKISVDVQGEPVEEDFAHGF